jgi:hypothetical protein
MTGLCRAWTRGVWVPTTDGLHLGAVVYRCPGAPRPGSGGEMRTFANETANGLDTRTSPR